MLEEKRNAWKPGLKRTYLIVRSYKPLEGADEAYDSFSNHPLVGKMGYDIFKLFYDVGQDSEVIPAEDIVSHVSTCSYADKEHTFVHPTIVTVVLDRVSSSLALGI